MNTIAIRPKIIRQLGIFLFNIFLLFASIILYYDDGITNKIIGTIGLIYFGINIMFNIYRLILPKYILVISEKGIIDNSTVLGIGFISWKYVNNIFITSTLGNKFISIRFKDIDKSDISEIKKLLIKINGIGAKKINISLKASDCNCKDILRIMQEYFEEYQKHNI